MNPIIKRLSTAIVILCLSKSAFPYDFEAPAGNNGYQKLQYDILSSIEQTVAVVGGTTGIIPCTVTYNNKTYTVTEIGRFAFSDVSITDFRLPLSLKVIRENAFGWCKASTIAIPDGVELIESDAFWYSSVETIIVGSSVKNIGHGAFYGCDNLKTLVFKPQIAPIHESRNYSIGNRYTTVIVPQLNNYQGTSIARVVSGSIVEPIYFKQSQFEYSGDVPNFEYVLTVNSATAPSNIALKNKDVGNYEQTFFIGINSLPSYRFSDFDGYSTYPNRGLDVTYNYSITPKTLTISINSAERQYGEINPAFTYSIEGFANGEGEEVLGSPIQCESSAKVNSHVGDYSITCNPVAMNYTFDIRNGILTVNKAPIDIIINNGTCVYGTSIGNVSYFFRGLRCNESSPDITSELQFTKYDISTNCGEYPITLVQGTLRDYFINEITKGILTVTKAPLTLTVNNTERQYYTENPAFDFTLTGLINNDDNSCISKIPVYNCDAITSSDCGEYTITPSNAEAMNYEITYVSGHLKITKAPLTLTANSLTREYGDSNPNFSFVVEGLRGDDTAESCMQESPKLTTTATINSAVGVYPIIISEGISKNYTLSYNSGKLTINKAPIHLTVLDATRQYGVSNPKFEFAYTGFKLSDNASTSFSQIPSAQTEATVKSPVGIYSITANGGLAKNYEITEYTLGTLTITKAPLTLTANNAERLYYTENPAFDFTLTGLLNNDDNSCISKLPTYNCSAIISSSCGVYPITPFNAEASNYDITYQDGKLTIKPDGLILVATNLSREYGDSNPVFKYEAIGLKGQDNIITALTNEPILSTTATENSNVGEYPITITGASSKNYTISYRQGTLTIDKAPLSVIAENAERMYGDNNPTFARTYVGFKLNDTENTAFSSLPIISCTASKSSDVGEYPISVEGGTSRNYQISEYHNGVLTITKAPIVLTATNKSRLYYEANPQFDFTLSGLRNSDTKSCISTTPTYSCSADITSNAGEYSIVPSNAYAKNYTLEYNNGVLTINQRSLTASVGNYTRRYNTENPLFEVTYTGFVNNENSSVLSNSATVSCNATKTSDVGSYTLTPMGGNATNYVISKYNNGTLIIEKADQSITWDQDLSSVELYSQIALNAVSDARLPIQYEMSPNNVATLYDNAGVWYLDCYGSGAVSIRAVQNGNNNYNAASMITKTLVVSGTGGDPSNPQIYLNVETAGTLPSMIAENRKYQIKNLRLTGNLNGTDINFLREMAGSDSNGNTTTGILETLDISGCTIVSGGRSYYRSYQTSNNKVGDYMFYNCKVLVNLMLPNNITSLGSYALADCNRLSVLFMPNLITSFGSYAFQNDISLLRIPMPTSLTSIGDMAFYGCSGLTDIIIPQNVHSIGKGIVNACENISRITVENGNTSFASKDGVLFTSAYDELLIFPVNYPSNEYVVAEGVNMIAPYAFKNAKNLNEVVFPEYLTTIGTDAFIGCVNLSLLTVAALTPPRCQNDCFDTVSKTRCQLRVPKGCYTYYWVAPVWSEFNNIVEYDKSIITDISYDDLKVSVFVDNHRIIIDNLPDGIFARVYQLNGSILFQEESTGERIIFNPCNEGIYLVVIANKTYKIVLH